MKQNQERGPYCEVLDSLTSDGHEEGPGPEIFDNVNRVNSSHVARIENLNRVLQAIRKVNHLIHTEKDPESLVRKSCCALVDTRGYNNAWIALYRPMGNFRSWPDSPSAVFQAGFNDNFSLLDTHLSGGGMITCLRKTDQTGSAVVIDSPVDQCLDCPLARFYSGMGGMTRRLEHRGMVFGILTVSIPGCYVHDREELRLFSDLADDLARALYTIELEKLRSISEEEIRSKNRELEAANEQYRAAIMELEMKNDELKSVNDAYEMINNELMRVYDELSISESTMKSIFRAAPVGIGLATDRTIGWTNDMMEKITGYTLEELEGRSIRLLYRNDREYEEVGTEQDRQIREQGTGTVETKWRRKQGGETDVLLSSTAISHENPEAGVVFTALDISERKRAEEYKNLAVEVLNILNQKLETDEIIKSILNMIRDFTGVDAAGIRVREGEDYPYYETIGFTNDFITAEQTLTGPSPGPSQGGGADYLPLLDCFCGMVIQGDTDPSHGCFTAGGSFWTNNLSELMDSPECGMIVPRLRGACRNMGYDSMALIPLRSGKEIVGLFQLNDRRRNRFSLEMIKFFEGLCSSIGIAVSRLQSEDQLKAALKEKITLIKEIHHRVKNNMQIVSSLLDLQSDQLENEKDREVLAVIQSRIRSMALVHEKLYQSDNFAEIDMTDYVESLVMEIFRTCMIYDYITHSIEVDGFHMELDRAIACGFLINELVTNALKHAFSDIEQGEIAVKFVQNDDDTFSLIVSDNGRGLPDDVSFEEGGSIGLQLVSALVNQLSGKIDIDRTEGTKFTITF